MINKVEFFNSKLFNIIKKNLRLVEITIVLGILYVIDITKPEIRQTINSFFQKFYSNIFPNNGVVFSYGYKTTSIIIGMSLLLLLRTKYIIRIFFPLHFLKEISIAILSGVIVSFFPIIGLLCGIWKLSSYTLNYTLGLFVFFIINALAEEIIFRAYPLSLVPQTPPNTVKKIFSNKFLWITSLFFGIGHVNSFGVWGLTGIMSGFAFCFLYLCRGNIWPSLFAHTGMQCMMLVKDMNFSLHFLVMGIALPCCCVFVWWLTFGIKKKNNFNKDINKAIVMH